MCKSSQLSCHYISKRSRQSHFPGEILLKKDTIEQSYLNAQSPLAESLLHDQLARSRFERCWQSVYHHQNEGRRLLCCCLHLRPRHTSGVRRGGGGGRCPRGQRVQSSGRLRCQVPIQPVQEALHALRHLLLQQRYRRAVQVADIQQNEGRCLLRCCLHLRPRHASGLRRGGGGGRWPRGQTGQSSSCVRRAMPVPKMQEDLHALRHLLLQQPHLRRVRVLRLNATSHESVCTTRQNPQSPNMPES
ncbi:hypothetical protein NP493_87g01001 [Ridgeia piscesae]|uniref:Uncharacterized protein n=1 Tax=Ridgeia piscesae TaxID=27915 RepID=A0AAD9P8K6_RIDPI|nr:hypothetical protein NP493_87g01001 [Ridgeia piscesae]